MISDKFFGRKKLYFLHISIALTENASFIIVNLIENFQYLLWKKGK